MGSRKLTSIMNKSPKTLYKFVYKHLQGITDLKIMRWLYFFSREQKNGLLNDQLVSFVSRIHQYKSGSSGPTLEQVNHLTYHIQYVR
jgi:hypothetical protein